MQPGDHSNPAEPISLVGTKQPCHTLQQHLPLHSARLLTADIRDSDLLAQNPGARSDRDHPSGGEGALPLSPLAAVGGITKNPQNTVQEAPAARWWQPRGAAPLQPSGIPPGPGCARRPAEPAGLPPHRREPGGSHAKPAPAKPEQQPKHRGGASPRPAVPELRLESDTATSMSAPPGSRLRSSSSISRRIFSRSAFRSRAAGGGAAWAPAGPGPRDIAAAPGPGPRSLAGTRPLPPPNRGRAPRSAEPDGT